MALASLVFPHRLLRASLEDTREAFLFRFDCRVASNYKAHRLTNRATSGVFYDRRGRKEKKNENQS